VSREQQHRDLQSQTRDYYSSDIVPEWLNFVYNDLASSTQFPFGKARELVLRHALWDHPVAKGTAYDIGCGGGQLSVALAEQGFSVRALDFSPAMLGEAKKLADQRGASATISFRQFDLVKDDASGFPGDGDIGIAMGFIEYLDDIGVFFNKSARMLRSGGLLLVEFRSRMFNATTGNAFMLADAESGALNDVVENFQGYCSSAGATAEHYQELAGAYRAAAEAMSRTKPPSEGTSLRKFFPTARHQHFIGEVDRAADQVGLRRIELYGMHPHPVCPSFESGQAWSFNQIGWQMQQFPRNPLVISTCSSMAALFELTRARP
jgi:2-polyprenyl-3-methyl-5-hydroxy-6-metoxy-1,4-benzoquinol methylase